MRIPVKVTTLHFSEKSALLLLLTVALIGFGGYEYAQQSQAVNDAVPVEATVVNASINRYEGGQGIDYGPDIHYRYQYRGETYIGERVFPGTTVRTYSDRSQAQSIVNSYEPGTTVRAYVTPATPSESFLIRERTPGPVRTIAVGGVGLVIALLAGLGSKNPGRQELRPASSVDSTAQRTWLGRNSETLDRLSKRLLALCFAAFWLSMVALFFGVLTVPAGTRGPSQTLQADLLGPIGLPLLAGCGFWIGMILALCLYGVASFNEYRQLRRRLTEPTPPSPFRRPSRLVTILGTKHGELSEYGRRVRLTGWVFVIAVGMTAVLTRILFAAS